MDETDKRFAAFSKEDNRGLQMLQNKRIRKIKGLGRDVSTKDILKTSNDLFIQQLIAYHTIMTIFKCINYKKPGYIYQKFKKKNSRK